MIFVENERQLVTSFTTIDCVKDIPKTLVQVSKGFLNKVDYYIQSDEIAIKSKIGVFIVLVSVDVISTRKLILCVCVCVSVVWLDTGRQKE